MPLGKHTRTESGTFRRERNDSLAGNLSKDYPEFDNYRTDTKLGTIKDKLDLPDDASLNQVRKAIREEF